MGGYGRYSFVLHLTQNQGDTSSDEVTGHMAVYPLVYHLLAETPAEKQRAYRLIDDTVRYIVQNNYQLIDVTGKPTTVTFLYLFFLHLSFRLDSNSVVGQMGSTHPQSASRLVSTEGTKLSSNHFLVSLCILGDEGRILPAGLSILD